MSTILLQFGDSQRISKTKSGVILQAIIRYPYHHLALMYADVLPVVWLLPILRRARTISSWSATASRATCSALKNSRSVSTVAPSAADC
jgi:hypothetical protein